MSFLKKFRCGQSKPKNLSPTEQALQETPRNVQYGNPALNDELRSSTDEILSVCPVFCILALDKSGVGKSSLINSVFGVDIANVSDCKAGVSDINEEIMSITNPHFVLHNLQGIHAIWFCTDVPIEGGSLFEVGDENFLNLQLENVPIIVVFTKYDLLTRKLELEADESIDDNELDTHVETMAQCIFDVQCVQHLKQAVPNKPMLLYVRVSKEPQYEETLKELVEMMQDRISDRLWFIWAIVQRIGREMWNLNDPHMYLSSEEFTTLMSHLVEDLADKETSSQHARQGLSAATMTTVTTVISTVVPPAAAVAMPITAGLLLAQWVFMVYQQTPGILCLLMGYIVNLTLVLESLFWIMRVKRDTAPVLRKDVKLAFNAYQKSDARTRVHHDIRVFAEKGGIFSPGQKDHALQEITCLINTYRFDLADVYKDTVRGRSTDEQDEEWGKLVE